MFGLMKACQCNLSDSARKHRRLHYCGLCKTLGRQYGSHTRFLLNNDTVFIAELLSSTIYLTTTETDQALSSFNCLVLPRTGNNLPLHLRYMAAVSLVLTEEKIADNLADSGNPAWNAARKILCKPCRSAAKHLQEWNFPLEAMRSTLAEQSKREQEALSLQTSSHDILMYLAEPTATATSMVCRHGAQLTGADEVADAFAVIGREFGIIAYLVDAIEDYRRDERSGEFNALRAAWGLERHTLLVGETLSVTVGIIREARNKVECALTSLPLSTELRTTYIKRLRSNLDRKLGKLLPVGWQGLSPATDQPAKHYCPAYYDFGRRWRHAVALTKEIAGRYGLNGEDTSAARPYSPMVFASVLPFAFVAPQQAATAASYRECLSLGMNLMVLGTLCSLLLAFVSRPFMAVAYSLGLSESSILKKKREGGTGESSGCCDSCDCCCCDSCDCDCCSCDC